MHYLRRFIALFLLGAISIYIAPKDLLHELSGHQDTRDEICIDTCAYHISEEHHHCDCLQLSSPPLYHSIDNFSFAFTVQFSVQSVENVTAYYFSLAPFLFFRGPPSFS